MYVELYSKPYMKEIFYDKTNGQSKILHYEDIGSRYVQFCNFSAIHEKITSIQKNGYKVINIFDKFEDFEKQCSKIDKFITLFRASY